MPVSRNRKKTRVRRPARQDALRAVFSLKPEAFEAIPPEQLTPFLQHLSPWQRTFLSQTDFIEMDGADCWCIAVNEGEEGMHVICQVPVQHLSALMNIETAADLEHALQLSSQQEVITLVARERTGGGIESYLFVAHCEALFATWRDAPTTVLSALRALLLLHQPDFWTVWKKRLNRDESLAE